jgi:hypothetical protein
MRVTAWHNIATDNKGHLIGMLDGYTHGHPLVPVATWDAPEVSVPLVVLEEAYALLNIGDDPAFGVPDERAVAYRARGNRSLSIGDVVQAGTTWAAVAVTGFTPIPEPDYVAIGANRPGTTSLPGTPDPSPGAERPST